MAEEQDAPVGSQMEDLEKKGEEEIQDSENDESEEESDEEDLFEVEKIISRKKKNGVYLYRVRWKGYPPSNDTWEPVENLDVVADLVRAFDKLQDEKTKSRQEERRLRKLRMEGKKLPGEKSSDENADSSEEESQLCDMNKFFKRLEKDKTLVWSQPDLYSKVKSRAASLASKKQLDEHAEELAVLTPSPSKTPSAQRESSRGRGRGRPRGGSASGRGRGRPPKETTGKSSEEEEAGGDTKLKSSGRGRGRPRKKLEKESSSESGVSDDSASLSDGSRTREGAQPVKEEGAQPVKEEGAQPVKEEGAQPVKEDSDAKGDSDDSAPLAELDCSKKDDSAPLAELDRSKKASRDSSEEKKDSEKAVSALKTGGKQRGRPPKKAVKENRERKEDSQDAAPVPKSGGRGRGRPRKVTSEDSDADPDKTKGKGRGRGRPRKKSMEESSEDQDTVDKSSVSRKTKGKGRGRPSKKPVKGSCEEKENSDDSAPLVKSCQAVHSQKLTSENSEENEASDVSGPIKKAGKGRGRPRKNMIIDTSEDNESDGAASLTKKTASEQDRSRMTIITEHSDENDSGGAKETTEGQGRLSEKTAEKIKSVKKTKGSKLATEPKVTSKTKNKSKSKKKLIIEDSDENVFDEAQEPLQSSKGNSVTKVTKTKKDSKNKKQHSSSSGGTSKKTSLKSEKISPSDTASPAKETPSAATDQAQEAGSAQSAVDSENTAKEAAPASWLSSSAKVQNTLAQGSSSTTMLPIPPVKRKPRPKAVIPVLEKLAMASVTHSFTEPSDHKVGEETKESSVSFRSREEQSELKSKESKDTTKSEKKSVSKGLKKGTSLKRKQDTAVEHTKAVKEGGASPIKVTCSRPFPLSTSVGNPVTPSPHPPADSQSVMNTASPALPSSPVDTSANLAAATSASDRHEAVLSDATTEDTKPVLSATQELPTEAKVKPCKSKQKTQSSKNHKNSPKSKVSAVKDEKKKVEKDGKSDEKNVKAVTHSSVPLTSPESSLQSSVSSESCVSDVVKTAALNKDVSAKSALAGSDVHSMLKPELAAAKAVKQDTSESKLTKAEFATSSMVRTQTVDKVSTADQTEPKMARVESDDVKKKHSVASELPPASAESGKQSMPRTSSTSDLSSPLSSGAGKQSMFRSGSTSELSSALSSGLGRQSLLSFAVSSPGRSTPTPSRESLLSTPSKETSGVFSSPSASREAPSPFLFSLSGRTGSWGSASPREQSQVPSSPKDPQLSGSSKDYLTSAFNRDLQTPSALSRDVPQTLGRETVASGFSHMTATPGFLYSPSSRLPQYPRDSWALPTRQDFNANIAGKESADKLYGVRSLYKSSPLTSADGDRAKQARGIDHELGEALRTIDLEYVEKQELAPVTPMELSHDELRQAVIDGNCYLVERALECSRRYDLDLPDNKGHTLLMNAVLRGCDDIIVHLLTRGASAEVQVKGITALMLAVEYAESSTVFMLLEMGAHVNTSDNNGETALFKAVRRGDKQILKLVLDHGADFNWTSHARLTALQSAKQYRLADIDVTLTDHIHRVVDAFEEEVRRVLRGTARLVSCLFPHRCVALRDTESFTVNFEYCPTLPSKPSMGCLLFIAHARFDSEVRCRLYGQCAVQKVRLNQVDQLCITEESNFVMVCHPLITGWNELEINTQKDPMSKAKLIVCAYRTELIR